MNAVIEFKSVDKYLGNKKVLNQISFSLEEGKIYSLIGESGSGKTTLIRLMNGLLTPDSGEIYLNNQPFKDKETTLLRRSMGYSIQGSGLFPHMTVQENISLIARRSGWSKAMINERCKQLLPMVGLNYQEFYNKKPRHLSGGQKQRVGIARALFMRPSILLMDEPFGALDPITRQDIQDWFIQLQADYKFSAVIVTHDMAEAFKISDKILLLNEGKIEQSAAPYELLLSPKTKFVEHFLSSHSPGHVLKNVLLYSVINKNLWVTTVADNIFKLTHLISMRSHCIENSNDLNLFHKQMNQQYIFYVNNELVFLNQEHRDNLANQSTVFLNLKDHFLYGLEQFIKEGIKPLPVVNDSKIIQGCFSMEAIRALF